MKIYNLIMKKSKTFPSPLTGEGKGGGEILPHKGGGNVLCCLPINSKGISVLFLVIAMLLMVTIGYVFSYLMPSKQKSIIFPIQSTQAFFIAQSGVEFAVRYATTQTPPWTTPAQLVGLTGVTRNLGSGTFTSGTFTLEYNSGNNTLTSKGEVPSTSEKRRISVSSFTSFVSP